MKFEFITTNRVHLAAWCACNQKLEQDLEELTTTSPSEEEVREYLTGLVDALQCVGNGMLFLMYDQPSSMPSDARVDFVYTPTYLAATILTTAMNRFEGIAADVTIQKVTHDVLEATMGRDFLGSGYHTYTGLLDTLEIFTKGDTVEFLKKHSEINQRFTTKFEEAMAFLEANICTGKVREEWSGTDYMEKGRAILKRYQKQKAIEPEYVWYACYGSNLSRERFLRYINRCADATPPVADRPFLFKHNIYFAKSAATWSDDGKAFLDNTSRGKAYDRIYKITRAQYEKVKRMEGRDYTKRVNLGTIAGLPVYSFTDKQRNAPVRMPSPDYFNTILCGLKECYEGILEETEMVAYLISTILPENGFAVAKAIKENPHYMTNTAICTRTGLDMPSVTTAVTWLVEHNVIQQDRRSVRAGHGIDDPQAFFFTVDDIRARGLIVAMIAATESACEKVSSQK